MPDPKKVKVYAGCEELAYSGYKWESGSKHVTMSRGDNLFEVIYSDIDNEISTQKHYCQGDTVYIDPASGYIECGAKAKTLHDQNCGATPTAETLLASEFVMDGEGDVRVCGIKLNSPKSEKFIGYGSECDSIAKMRDEMSEAYLKLQMAQETFTNLMRGLSTSDKTGAECNIARMSPDPDGTRIKFSYSFFDTKICSQAQDAFKSLITEEEIFDKQRSGIISNFKSDNLEKGPVEMARKYIELRKQFIEAMKNYGSIKDFEETIDVLFKTTSDKDNLETRYIHASTFVSMFAVVLEEFAKIPKDKLEPIKKEVEIKFPEEETKSWPSFLRAYRMMKAVVDIHKK